VVHWLVGGCHWLYGLCLTVLLLACAVLVG
jgi:hypothetical protein